MSEIEFVKVLNNYISDFINKARERILIVKPAFFKSEVEQLLNVVQFTDIKCTIFLEAGDQAVRYGYGDLEGLKLISINSDKFNVQTAQHIRLSTIIVDDEAVVYTPAALYMENEPNEIAFPNGFYAGKDIVNQILTQFNLEKKEVIQIENKSKIIPFPKCNIDTNSEETAANDIKVSIKRLEEIPSVDPSKLRKVNF